MRKNGGFDEDEERMRVFFCLFRKKKRKGASRFFFSYPMSLWDVVIRIDVTSRGTNQVGYYMFGWGQGFYISTWLSVCLSVFEVFAGVDGIKTVVVVLGVKV